MHGTITTGTPVDINMANNIMTAWTTLFASSGLQQEFSADEGAGFVSVRDIRSPSLAMITSTAPAAGGAAPGDSLPAQIAAVVTLRTAKAGKGFRGRAYIPGFSEASNDTGGVMTAATKAALDLYAAGLQNVFLAGLVTLGVAKRPIYNDADCTIVTPGETNAVTQVLVRNDLWDTQRRRAGRT
jgi:hypothetical protein